MTDKFAGARYTNLCTQGTKLQATVDVKIGRRRRVAYLLMEAEDKHPANIPQYRGELEDLKERIHADRGVLMQHVAHCADGCVRDNRGGLSQSAYSNAGAPAHQKPPLPSMADLAARLREGEALEAIATEYDRHPDTLRQRLNMAGFNARTGKPTTRPAKVAKITTHVLVVADELWRDDALCAQTDPEIFYPDRGGSTREAKSVCANCTVSAECLDSAIANDERFGLWGGLSERDRRKVAKANREQAAS